MLSLLFFFLRRVDSSTLRPPLCPSTARLPARHDGSVAARASSSPCLYVTHSDVSTHLFRFRYSLRSPFSRTPRSDGHLSRSIAVSRSRSSVLLSSSCPPTLALFLALSRFHLAERSVFAILVCPALVSVRALSLGRSAAPTRGSTGAHFSRRRAATRIG